MTLDLLMKDSGFLISVFVTMRDGFMIVDKDGNIVFFNRAAEDIAGCRKNEVMSKHCTILDSDTCTALTDEGKQ